MTDRIFIRQFPVQTIIGIYDWERTTPQTLIFDLDMCFDCSLAGQSDDIAHALDYKQVHDTVKAFVENSQFFLIEKLASEVMDFIFKQFAVEALTLTVNKKGAVGAGIDVGITLTRNR